MLLITGQRDQTLIACRVDHKDLCVSHADLWLSTTLKTSKPNFHQAPLEKKAFPGDRRICPFTYLGISSAHCQITSNKRIVHTASTTPHTYFKGHLTVVDSGNIVRSSYRHGAL